LFVSFGPGRSNKFPLASILFYLAFLLSNLYKERIPIFPPEFSGAAKLINLAFSPKKLQYFLNNFYSNLIQNFTDSIFRTLLLILALWLPSKAGANVNTFFFITNSNRIFLTNFLDKILTI
jgi:hypothetical protein